jgi:outer membrane protein
LNKRVFFSNLLRREGLNPRNLNIEMNTMKHIALFAILSVAGWNEGWAQKLGHVNAQEILLSLPERADAEYEGELTRMQSELETKFGEYQAKVATWPDAIRQQKERELQQLDQGLQEFSMTVQNDLAVMEQNLLAPMIERVSNAIEAVGKEQGFTYIFDASTGVTLYNGGTDVSDLVRTKLGM